MTKKDQMRAIRDEVWNLESSPLYKYRKKNNYYPVIGEGNHDASCIFIGEAPGENEAKTGRPFCGAAGRVLDELLATIALRRQDIYVTNIVKDRPPGNRDPVPLEIALYSPFLIRQIDIIQPKVIATLGRFSMKYLLETFDAPEKTQSITALHGRPLSINASYGTIHMLPLYHPAVAIYNTNTKQTLIEDFQKLKDYL